MKRFIILALSFLALALPAAAQNTVPTFSWGPTLPMYKWPLEGSSSQLPAGAGVVFWYNTALDESATMARLSIGAPLFVSGEHDPNTFFLTTGLTLGTLNGMVSGGIVCDVVRATSGSEPGGLFDGIQKRDFALVASFSLNFGSGVKSSTVKKAGAIVSGQASHIERPPGYIGIF